MVLKRSPKYMAKCHGKKPYDTKQMAREARFTYSTSDDKYAYYLCTFCSKWHIGHK